VAHYVSVEDAVRNPDSEAAQVNFDERLLPCDGRKEDAQERVTDVHKSSG